MDAFDADVIIQSAQHAPATTAVAALFEASDAEPVGVGSVILMVETRPKPLRTGDEAELVRIDKLLQRLELLEVTKRTTLVAVDLAARYRLRAADAIHLATAVEVGADRFITNNRRDFPRSIEEIAVTYPEDLASASR